MNDDHLGELIATFGEAVGRAIRSWERGYGSRLALIEKLPGGTTGATVVLVIERPPIGEPRKLVVKVCPPEEGGDVSPEPERHLKAQRLDPAFAAEHIVEMVYNPVLVDDGSWVAFQAVAGAGPPVTPPLLTLVQGVKDGWRGRRAPLCTADDLAAVCGRIVRSVLEDWRPPGGVEPGARPMPVRELMESLLQERDRPGRCVHTWAAAHRPELLDPSVLWIEVDGLDCPNPLALARSGLLGGDREVLALTGPSHGDLHPGNIFVPVKRMSIGSQAIPPFSTYWLGDLSRFEVDAPLAADPVHFVLSLAALQLPDLSERQQDALLRYVVDIDDVHSQALLPCWAQRVIAEILRAIPRWIERSFATEWREQTLLALVAWGLIFAGRRTTADAQRPWFFRVAAHAARAYLGDTGPGARVVALPPRSGPSAGGEPLAASGSGPAGEPRPTPGEGQRHLRPADLLRAGDELAEQVRAQWTRAAAGRRLISPHPVRVRWEKAVARGTDEVTLFLRRGQVAVHPVVERTEREVAPATDLFPLYCSVGSGIGRLVITGAPGAGKSAAAILLALDVLSYRAQIDHEADRAAVAVPVILTPHEWEPHRQDLVSWMAQRICADYPLLRSRRRGRKAAEALVRGRRIALFLDGLDEMPMANRSKAAQALRDAPGLVVVLSRSEALSGMPADAGLTSVPTVELQPVAPDEAVDYLRRCQADHVPPGWANVLEHVGREPDGPLARTLDSPLMLGLVRDVYGRDPAAGRAGADDLPQVDELLDAERFPSREDVEDHLLRQVVPTAYSVGPAASGQPVPGEQAERWLNSFAHLMRENDTRDLAWWRLQQVIPRWKRFVVNSFLTAVFPAVLFGLVGGLGDHPLRGFLCGLAIGPIASAFDVTVVDRGRGLREATSGGIALGYLLAGTATGVIAAALLIGARAGLPTGLLAGTAAGGVGGATAAWEAARHLATSGRPTSAVDGTTTPGDDWREGTRQSRRFGLLLGATVGTTLAFVSWRAGEPVLGVVGTALAGLAVMPFTVVALSPRTKTTLTALQLWRQRRSPVRVVRFLEEARERNVLRVVGPVYQFRHARLQDVLAESWDEQVAAGDRA